MRLTDGHCSWAAQPRSGAARPLRRVSPTFLGPSPALFGRRRVPAVLAPLCGGRVVSTWRSNEARFALELRVHRDRIRELRQKQALSQEALAELSGLHPRTIQRIEASGIASVQSVRSMARALGVEPIALELAPGIHPAMDETFRATATIFQGTGAAFFGRLCRRWCGFPHPRAACSRRSWPCLAL